MHPGAVVGEVVSEAVKRIEVDQLVTGMFIHDLSCDWMSHPFFRGRFLLTDPADVVKIRDAGIRYIYIDTSRGKDAQAPAPTLQQIEANVDEAIATLAEGKASRARVETSAELHRAKQLHSEATGFVKRMMSDVRLGKVIAPSQGEEMVERMTDSIFRNPGAMLSVCQVRDKDEYTFHHSVSVCALMVAFGRSLKMPRERLHEVGLAGLLHDVGKALTPDAVLNKPGRLTTEEYETIKRHPLDGYRLLEGRPGLGEDPLKVVLQHHERVDGTGYPNRLPPEKFEEIGRMGAICDVYDAITADRVYHRGVPPTRALRNMLEWSGTHLDRALVQSFIRCIGIYPVGSLVRLRSERLAVVVEQSETNLLQPHVRVIFDAKFGRFLVPQDLDLGAHGAQDVILRYEDPAAWKIDTQRFL